MILKNKKITYIGQIFFLKIEDNVKKLYKMKKYFPKMGDNFLKLEKYDKIKNNFS